MIPAIKSEFRKLFTVRSTYVILGICVAIELLFAFYVTGWKLKPAELMSQGFLASQVVSAITTVSLFAAIICVLLVTHEYRYNTIHYSLTSNSSRTRVLLAKFIAMSCFVVLFTIVYGLMSPLLSLAAIHLRHLHMGPQIMDYGDLLWRSLFAGWGMAVYAFIIAVLVRIQVGAVVAIFLIPSTLENLLGLLLKTNQVYLPYSSLNILLGPNVPGSPLSYGQAALVSGSYMLVGLVVSWAVFLKRDAN